MKKADYIALVSNIIQNHIPFNKVLGLRLESTKGPVEVLVIDSVEKPVED